MAVQQLNTDLSVVGRVEVRAGVRMIENQNAKLNFDSKTELGKIFPLQLDVHGLHDGCQRPGLRGRTSVGSRWRNRGGVNSPF